MIAWLTQNLATILIGAALLFLLALAARRIYKARKQGGCAGCPGCSGGCSRCAEQKTTTTK